MTSTVISTNTSSGVTLTDAGDSLTILASGSLIAPSATVIGLANLDNSVNILGYAHLQYIWLLGGDEVLIGKSGVLVSEGNAIYVGNNGGPDLHGDSTVVNDGTISAASVGITAFGGSNQITNNGLIAAQNVGIYIRPDGASGNYVTNNGQISASYEAVRVDTAFDNVVNSGVATSLNSAGMSLLAANQTVTNTGQINGHTSGLDIWAAGDTIRNLGSIVSATGHGLDVQEAADLHVTNSGTLEGAISGIFDWGGSGLTLINSGHVTGISGPGIDLLNSTLGAVIRNSGTIAGADQALRLGSGADRVINTGTLTGDVALGAGDDILDTRWGLVTGTIAGGDGSDTYLIGDAGIDLVEGAGLPGDVDVVKSTVSYQLAAEFETLTLLTGNDLKGIGNTAANTINGNAGDNRLAGLAGADTLSGNAGDDLLLGNLGNDSLLGGDGDDRLIGGAGKDSLAGGADGDSFVFQSLGMTGATAATADTILDFTRGEDKIDLSKIDAIRGNAASDNSFTFISHATSFTAAGQVRWTSSGGNTFVYFDVNGDNTADGVIKLVGTLTLNASDFIL